MTVSCKLESQGASSRANKLLQLLWGEISMGKELKWVRYTHQHRLGLSCWEEGVKKIRWQDVQQLASCAEDGGLAPSLMNNGQQSACMSSPGFQAVPVAVGLL